MELDELLLLLAEYVNNKEITEKVNEYVNDYYEVCKSCIEMGKTLEAIEVIAGKRRTK